MSHSKGSVGREPGVPPQGSNIVYRSREEAVGEPVGKADSRDEHFQHVLNTLLGSQTYQQPQFSSSKKEDIDTYGVGSIQQYRSSIQMQNAGHTGQIKGSKAGAVCIYLLRKGKRYRLLSRAQSSSFCHLTVQLPGHLLSVSIPGK